MTQAAARRWRTREYFSRTRWTCVFDTNYPQPWRRRDERTLLYNACAAVGAIHVEIPEEDPGLSGTTISSSPLTTLPHQPPSPSPASSPAPHSFTRTRASAKPASSQTASRARHLHGSIWHRGRERALGVGPALVWRRVWHSRPFNMPRVMHGRRLSRGTTGLERPVPAQRVSVHGLFLTDVVTIRAAAFHRGRKGKHVLERFHRYDGDPGRRQPLCHPQPLLLFLAQPAVAFHRPR
jgi:hypothetical protein